MNKNEIYTIVILLILLFFVGYYVGMLDGTASANAFFQNYIADKCYCLI